MVPQNLEFLIPKYDYPFYCLNLQLIFDFYNFSLSSRRYVTDQMFYKEKHLKNLDLTICEDELLECSNCWMVVHKNCYPCGGTKITPESLFRFHFIYFNKIS